MNTGGTTVNRDEIVSMYAGLNGTFPSPSTNFIPVSFDVSPGRFVARGKRTPTSTERDLGTMF